MAAEPSAETTEVVAQPALTNADRLQAHLKPEGLASALLKAWQTASPNDSQARLLAVINSFDQQKEPLDDQAAAQ